MAKSRRGAKSGQRYVQVHEYIMRSPGWRRLSPLARCAWLEFGLYYNGSNNGRLAVSSRMLADRLDVGKSSAARAIEELVNCGFLETVRASDFGQKKNSAEYCLTHLRCDATSAMASKKFLRDFPSVNGAEVCQFPKTATRGG